MSLKFLITGAGGYIGSVLVEELLKRNYKVVALDRFFFGNTLSGIRSQNLKVIKDDTRSFDESLFKGVDVVIDLASLSNDASAELDKSITKSINFDGPIRVATLAKKVGVKKYLFSSSCSVYGASHFVLTERSHTNPVSLYAKYKLAAEKVLLGLCDSDFCVTVLRNGTVYGLSPRRMRFDLIVNTMTYYAHRDNRILINGGGTQWRPLIHIQDIIQALLLVSLEKDLGKVNQEIFNVGSNEQNYQVYKVANIFKIPFPRITIEESSDEPDPRNYRVNFEKIAKILGYRTKYQVLDGIIEMKKALDRGTISDNLTTNTWKYYKHLLEADKLLSSIKLNGKLFEP